MESKRKNAILALLAAGLAATASHAAFKWTDCKDIAATDFKVTPIVTRAAHQAAEPMKMAFDLLAPPTRRRQGEGGRVFHRTDGQGPQVRFQDRHGDHPGHPLHRWHQPKHFFRRRDGHRPGSGLQDQPLRLHLLHTSFPPPKSPGGSPASPWTTRTPGMDPGSEAIVLKIPIHGGSKHPRRRPGSSTPTGIFGSLPATIITTGEFPVWSSANTNDLRGKILRIHPTADGKYTIPSGNLFPSGTAAHQARDLHHGHPQPLHHRPGSGETLGPVGRRGAGQREHGRRGH